MTVRKNIEYGLKLRRLDKTEVERRIEEALAITQLTRFVERLPGQLSGGQQQRVALARALAIRPNVLLLDEPLNAVDAATRSVVAETLRVLHAQGKTIIAATHELEHLETDFDAALYLVDGRET